MIFFFFIFQVYEPHCSLSAGGKYNPTNGFCETPETDRTVSLNRGFCTELSCHAQTFQSMFQDCYDTSCLEVNSKCQQPQNQCMQYYVFNRSWRISTTPNTTKIFLIIFKLIKQSNMVTMSCLAKKNQNLNSRKKSSVYS